LPSLSDVMVFGSSRYLPMLTGKSCGEASSTD
jgi:hypothetical protein